jgi:hypothetical protein
MKRLSILILGVFCFVLLLCSTADAGPIRKLIERFRRDRPAAEKKIDLKRRHAPDNREPSTCPNGICPIAK